MTTFLRLSFLDCLMKYSQERLDHLDGRIERTNLVTEFAYEVLKKTEGVTKNEANSFVGKNVITRALGVKENVEADYRLMRIKPGDKFMLCSDGLCGFADDDEIFEVA